jgi:hypothetical protein
MSLENRTKLQRRVADAASAAFAARSYVGAIDVLTGVRWLDLATLDRWKQGQLPFLLQGIQTASSRIAEAMEMFRVWTTEQGLDAIEIAYVARGPARAALQFTQANDSATERFYRTHWVSRELSEPERQRQKAKLERPPELVVVQPLDAGWTCHRCGGTGDLLIMEPPGPSCLACAGLAGLEFLPAGDPGLTRNARAKSTAYAVVVRFSRARKRYERKGLLVEPDALRAAERESHKSSRSPVH